MDFISSADKDSAVNIFNTLFRLEILDFKGHGRVCLYIAYRFYANGNK